MNQEFDISLFTFQKGDIVERLYKETPIICNGNLDDFLKLPVNENYKKEQEKKI